MEDLIRHFVLVSLVVNSFLFAAAAPIPCYCSDGYVPVCGVDGVTYMNACEADCADAIVAYPYKCHDVPIESIFGNVSGGGIPKPDFSPDSFSGRTFCSCNNAYAPVCGANKRTMRNSCLAACSDIEILYVGPCRRLRGSQKHDATDEMCLKGCELYVSEDGCNTCWCSAKGQMGSCTQTVCPPRSRDRTTHTCLKWAEGAGRDL
eukprot:Platyproteum_vivax@DN906_c0_g1_i1.p1